MLTCWPPESVPDQLLAGATTMAVFLAEAFPSPKSLGYFHAVGCLAVGRVHLGGALVDVLSLRPAAGCRVDTGLAAGLSGPASAAALTQCEVR